MSKLPAKRASNETQKQYATRLKRNEYQREFSKRNGSAKRLTPKQLKEIRLAKSKRIVHELRSESDRIPLFNLGKAAEALKEDMAGEKLLHEAANQKRFNSMVDELYKPEHPTNFPENPLNLSIIQEALLNCKGTDILSLSLRLGAKTDIRDTIKWIIQYHSGNPDLIVDIVGEYPLELILAMRK